MPPTIDRNTYPYYDTKRHRKSLDHAWRIAELELPDGWSIVELCRLYGPARVDYWPLTGA